MNTYVILSIILLAVGIGLLLAMSHYYHLWRAACIDQDTIAKDMASAQGIILELKETAAIDAYCREGLEDFKVYVRKPGKKDVLVTYFPFGDDYMWAKLRAEELAEQIKAKL